MRKTPVSGGLAVTHLNAKEDCAPWTRGTSDSPDARRVLAFVPVGTRAPAWPAQGREVGVTPEMLVAPLSGSLMADHWVPARLSERCRLTPVAVTLVRLPLRVGRGSPIETAPWATSQERAQSALPRLLALAFTRTHESRPRNAGAPVRGEAIARAPRPTARKAIIGPAGVARLIAVRGARPKTALAAPQFVG